MVDVEKEVADAFERYNAALDAGDVDALNGFFWKAAETVRFGPSENLFGHEAITQFRSRRWAAAAPRRLVRLQVTVLGPDAAVTSALFARDDTGGLSRQTQAWRRIDQTWQIVAAHVSSLSAT